MSEFKQYRRSQIAEIREVTSDDIYNFLIKGNIRVSDDSDFMVSISDADRKNGSPKLGDMIARNPNNNDDQWLIAQKYFKKNFEKI